MCFRVTGVSVLVLFPSPIVAGGTNVFFLFFIISEIERIFWFSARVLRLPPRRIFPFPLLPRRLYAKVCCSGRELHFYLEGWGRYAIA